MHDPDHSLVKQCNISIISIFRHDFSMMVTDANSIHATALQGTIMCEERISKSGDTIVVGYFKRLFHTSNGLL